MQYFGHKMNMSTTEIDTTPLGMMLDMINADAIYNGAAQPRKKKKYETLEEVIFG